jgi:5-methylcytosine-specific restriction endonuclease McrA
MTLYACHVCGKRSPNRRCPAHPLRKRARGNAFEPVRMAVAERDNWTCQECGRPVTRRDLHIDHVVPRAAGGSDEPSNLQVLCEPCNLKKGTR